MVQIEPLSRDHLAQAVALSTEAGWNQCREDWERLLALSPEGCFGGYVDGRLVATTTVVTYGQAVAWIGMVLVTAAHRQHGYGSALFDHGRRYARGRADTVGLDATDAGKSLYERQGFRETQTVERWMGSIPADSPAGTASDCTPAPPIAAVIGLDRRATGVDRSRLLRSLASSRNTTVLATGPPDDPVGYAVVRPGRLYPQIGPLVAPDAGTATALVCGLARHADIDRCLIDVIANDRTTTVPRALGFERQRVLARMTHDASTSGLTSDTVWAITDFALG